MNIIKATDNIRITEHGDRFAIKVRDDNIWRHATTADTYDDARPLANLAHNTLRRGGDAADAIIAVISAQAERVTRTFVGIDMGEAVWSGVNIALGLCPDGCCGGPECMSESEIPAWNAWATRLRDAVERSNV